MSKILVVEDDEFLAETIADCLIFTGHNADRIGTGTEACQMLKTNQYDLVLLDSMLPDMNGLDILKVYKEEKGTAKVLFLTGAKKNEEAAMELGADYFLSKPFEIDELLSVVNKLTSEATTQKSS
jgi:DNA-binding response OmpR family regulator